MKESARMIGAHTNNGKKIAQTNNLDWKDYFPDKEFRDVKTGSYESNKKDPDYQKYRISYYYKMVEMMKKKQNESLELGNFKMKKISQHINEANFIGEKEAKLVYRGWYDEVVTINVYEKTDGSFGWETSNFFSAVPHGWDDGHDTFENALEDAKTSAEKTSGLLKQSGKKGLYDLASAKGHASMKDENYNGELNLTEQ